MYSYKEACERARTQSMAGYVQHVNAVILPPELKFQEPEIKGYIVSDWTDGSTVVSFYKGEKL